MNTVLSVSFCVLICALTVTYVWKLYDHKLPPIVEGFFQPEFMDVAMALRHNMESGKEQGASFAVYYKGEAVIDMWAGYADTEAHRRWRNQTTTQAFDSTNGAMAILIGILNERGSLDYGHEIAEYWTEFRKHGKDKITLETLFTHQAGLPYLTEPLSLRELKTDEEVEKRLIDQEPVWTPGSQAEYHELTLGLYADRLLGKVDSQGRFPQEIFHQEVSKPFGIELELNLKSENFANTARLHRPSWSQKILQALASPKYLCHTVQTMLSNSFMPKAVTFLKEYNLPVCVFNNPELREITLSSLSGTGTARGLAKLFSIVANDGYLDGKRVLSQKVLKRLTTAVSSAVCPVTYGTINFTTGLQTFTSPLGEQTYGHAGYGGQIVIADPTRGLSIAYLTNHLSIYRHGDDPRFVELQNAVYRNLDKYIARLQKMQQ